MTRGKLLNTGVVTEGTREEGEVEARRDLGQDLVAEEVAKESQEGVGRLDGVESFPDQGLDPQVRVQDLGRGIGVDPPVIVPGREVEEVLGDHSRFGSGAEEVPHL